LIFKILKDPEKIEQLQKRLKAKYPYTLEKFGKIVGYEMPALPQPFPRLLDLLEKGKYPQKFWGIEYYLATNEGYIDRIIPAAEYYKYAFRSIADKHYSLGLSVKRIEELGAEIKETYKAVRITLSRTSQPFFSVQTQVYSLKRELGNLFFISRSIMDSIATLMHFLYGPSSNPFSSFADFKKYICKAQHSSGSITDNEMKHYIESEMSWFSRLRDIRDYITHYKSIDISFYEQATGGIDVYLEDQFEVGELIQSIHDGVSNFLKYLDEHFSRRLKEQA
jgi:hypothetical protein